MEVNLKSVEKLQKVFREAWSRISAGDRPECVECEPGQTPEWFWGLYMNHLDCLMVDQNDLLESFPDMVNFGVSVKESVCLLDPCFPGDYLLVPNGLAEKCLVLGTLA